MTNIPEIVYEKYSFGNAWARAISNVMRNKNAITFGGKIKDKEQFEEKHAYDSDQTIVLGGNALKEAFEGKLHPQFPTKGIHLSEYLKEWERGYDWKKQGFDYNYENRCEAYVSHIAKSWASNEKYVLDGTVKFDSLHNGMITIDQWKLAREDLANQIETGIQSNRNVIVIGNPSIDRFNIPDSPPCLREIWIRYEDNNNVVVETTWRSRDLYAAWMTNVVGLLSAVKREVTDPNNCNIVQYCDRSRSLHVYSGDWDDASKVKLLPVNPQMMGR